MKNFKWLFVICFLNFYSLFAQTGTINGLCVVVDFPDQKFLPHVDSVSALFNRTNGAAPWGHIGSIKQYFLEQSNNKLSINTQVIKIALSKTYSYYETPQSGVDKGQEMVKDVVDAINAAYPAGFPNLTVHPTENRLRHFFLLKYVPNGGGVAFGLNPGLTIKSNGVNIPVGNVGTANWYNQTKPEMNVICHEMGHSVLDWTDYYQTAWSNLGDYCVMGSAGTPIGPMPINPVLRYLKGWVDNVIEIGNTTQTYQITSGNYHTVHKYTNPANPKEYLILYPYVHGGFYQASINNKISDQGLAIFYVDENQGMDGNYQTGGGPKITLVQADNLDELHDEDVPADVRGDLNDFFGDDVKSFGLGSFFKWKNGGFFGLDLSDISNPGATMSFKVNAELYHSISTDGNGYLFLQGTFPISSGQLRSFACYPNPGYETYQLKINGQIQDLNQPFTRNFLTNNTFEIKPTENTIIEVSFRKKINPTTLTAPWSSTQIGNATGFGSEGISPTTNEKIMYVESTGSDIWGNSDNFGFVYQKLVGDGKIQGQLTHFNKIHDWNKAGLMIRENLTANSKYGYLCFTPRNHIRVQQRLSDGDYAIDGPYTPSTNTLHFFNLYKWFKIERTGNLITYSLSRDGVTWKKYGEQTIQFGSEVYVGLAVTGSNGVTPIKGIFENVTVTSSNTNTCTNPAWNGTTAYTSGQKVSYNGRTYSANWWNQNQRPDLNTGSGKPWTDLGVCGSNQNTSCSAPTWNAATAYSGGATVLYNGIKYTANWWTQNQRPDLNTQIWTNNGACSARIGEQTTEENVLIYPNPSTGQFTIHSLENTNVTIYNSLGQVIINQSLTTGDNSIELISSGIYFIHINETIQKLIIE